MKDDLLKEEFWRWYRDIDQAELCDVFDLALGFYKGRHPRRSHDLGLKFADTVRAKARLEAALTTPLPAGFAKRRRS